MDGLGNQIFNYALGRRLSIELGVPLKLDLKRFSEKREFPFTYKLHNFNIKQDVATAEEIGRIRDGKGLNKLQSLQFKLRRRTSSYALKPYVIERIYEFDPEILTIPDNTYIAGLWQTEKYFKPVENQLREDLRLINEPDAKNKEFAEMINRVDSVSIHHRRKEFAGDRGKKDHQVLMTQAYYDRALKKISETVKNPHLFLFSDEMEWVKEHLRFDFPVVYVEHNLEEEKHIEDFRLLSLCKHNIISTSTFSWWSAWLNSNPDKIVIAPKTWFTGGKNDPRDVVPDEWLRMEV